MARAKKSIQEQQVEPEIKMITASPKDNTVIEIPEEAKLSNVAKVHTRVLDPHGILRNLKKEFMLACSRIRGSEDKFVVMMDFLDLAPFIARHQYNQQKRRRENELK